ncbi:unnamed protein product [Diplocarpon coronariae]|uniref:Uncharacterized protein n=1 Tax=Diplocarpon coronariae TaxID=2795749 RepID=A0A218ZA82_9HELO|nr:hypothetical protein B2J93_1352 [Marssonina coronariae]
MALHRSEVNSLTLSLRVSFHLLRSPELSLGKSSICHDTTSSPPQTSVIHINGRRLVRERRIRGLMSAKIHGPNSILQIYSRSVTLLATTTNSDCSNSAILKSEWLTRMPGSSPTPRSTTKASPVSGMEAESNTLTTAKSLSVPPQI